MQTKVQIETELKSLFTDDNNTNNIVVVEVKPGFLENCLTKTDEIIPNYWVAWAYCKNTVVINYCEKPVDIIK